MKLPRKSSGVMLLVGGVVFLVATIFLPRGSDVALIAGSLLVLAGLLRVYDIDRGEPPAR